MIGGIRQRGKCGILKEGSAEGVYFPSRCLEKEIDLPRQRDTCQRGRHRTGGVKKSVKGGTASA